MIARVKRILSILYADVRRTTNTQMLVVVLTWLILMLFWRQIESIAYGEATPRIVDDIIGIILMLSIFYNVRYWNDLKHLRKKE